VKQWLALRLTCPAVSTQLRNAHLNTRCAAWTLRIVWVETLLPQQASLHRFVVCLLLYVTGRSISFPKPGSSFLKNHPPCSRGCPSTLKPSSCLLRPYPQPALPARTPGITQLCSGGVKGCPAAGFPARKLPGRDSLAESWDVFTAGSGLTLAANRRQN